MKICSKCGCENNDNASFCNNCGADIKGELRGDPNLMTTCPACGEPVAKTTNRCPHCGYNIGKHKQEQYDKEHPMTTTDKVGAGFFGVIGVCFLIMIIGAFL